MEERGGNYHIKGFNDRYPDSLADKISKFLNQNPELELIDIKYSSHGYVEGSDDQDYYSALVICREK